MDQDNYMKLNQIATYYIREYAYQHGKDIYHFMKKFGIGENTYGHLMDSIGRTKHVMTHRLYGHHIIYDFPIGNLEKSGEFLEHLFSDFFTKQGLPIIPGEILEDTDLISYCDRLSHNWNFVNGFDILVATVAIYQGQKDLSLLLNTNFSIDTFEDFARNLGVGGLELAISLSSGNPFLLIGAILQLTSGLVGILNEGSRIYVEKANEKFYLEVKTNEISLESNINQLTLDSKISQSLLESQLNKFDRDNVLERILKEQRKNSKIGKKIVFTGIALASATLATIGIRSIKNKFK